MKNRDYIIYTLITFFAFCSQFSYAQTTGDIEASISRRLSIHYKKYPREKLFIHTDQNLYVNGQVIWYKIYAAAYGKPSGLSKIVYVHLSDSAGNVLVKNKLPLTDGHAYGDIELPRNLHSGWYQLTGFTAWMLNFDKADFYHQNIYIQNFNEVAKTPVQHAKKYHITFFPEGGDPVEGVVCNIAFKAADQDGMPVKVEGEVLNSDKKEIAKITTVHDGMGMFSIEGYAGKKNTAVVHFTDGPVQSVDLPQFKKTGISMQVNNQPPDAVELKIACDGDSQQYKNVLLAAYQDKGFVQTYPIKLEKGINVFDIKKNEFSTGILRLTLFDQQGMPQAERIVFIDRNDQLKLSLITDSISFKNKALSVFKLKSSTSDNKADSANFSVSVTDADAVSDTDDDNIYTSLLLSSELKSKVYHPAYYFTNSSDSLKQQLDLVMMTSGWRHFKWDKDTVSIKYPVEQAQFIAGKIVNYHPVSDKDQLKIKIIISSEADSSKYVGYVTPDSSGSFILKDYNHKGPATIYFEVANAKNHKQKMQVQFFKPALDTLKIKGDTLTGNVLPEIKNDWLAEEKMLAANGVIMLNAVEIKTKKITPTEQVIKDHVVRLQADMVFSLDLVNGTEGYSYTDILSMMKGRFPGLLIYGDTFIYHGGNSLGYGNSDHLPAQPNAKPPSGAFLPYFYLNEQPVSLGDIKDVPLPEIALIQFAPAPVWFAPYNGGNVGAIMVYTRKQGDDIVTFRKEAFDRYTFNGYTITREFASPDYSAGRSSVSDTRTTLYWNHDLNTNSSGNAKFHFYNSDKAKRFRVVIQGMDAEGRIGYLEQVF